MALNWKRTPVLTAYDVQHMSVLSPPADKGHSKVSCVHAAKQHRVTHAWIGTHLVTHEHAAAKKASLKKKPLAATAAMCL
jgi:hypothetical protein